MASSAATPNEESGQLPIVGRTFLQPQAASLTFREIK